MRKSTRPDPSFPIILAVESSCDETSAAISKNGEILSNIVATQAVHENYGGVVPELASRAHQQNIVPIVHQALRDANITKTMLNAAAYTQGPGLLGALLVGSSFVKSLAWGLQIPLLSVNHMQAHILAHFIESPQPQFPFLCLTVSGGHTQLVVVRDYLDMEIIGETLDDAVGEAFDKIAKLLGLPYPGGPHLDRIAQQGNPKRFSFPITSMPDLNFSFSGIKTAVLYFLRDQIKQNERFVEENLPDLCASVQATLISMLLEKVEAAVSQTGIREIAIAGGVSANSGLRNQLKVLAQQKQWQVYIPKIEYCTDNAAMIAMAAHYQYLGGQTDTLTASPNPRLKFGKQSND
ncbi:tRNA (adenosine(37)-N6)-threonylcarbamoyltransferase complex transferase subunit TsaD [Tunicatimonas pelagia]|uniref:tRNA (adenosine(37)-N6)-threonylcarbamoyltransferase complex transferase subunit TsaD n=1 Tax=Tunicatimonas pelagia TaxID=931531 RepID=UPI002665D987|nr:tRNA (adenosine(37)-N6)-threonylcarbamoyltransferase complex transferase subunit TsaD [Tunicatimonas pelagia]WKN44343.1 tRNA (adenosine(37)-N6)-threonylcarbamoyltransferase complex transferase subunit TsaD [Tunicatimonas pelagia]